MSIDADYLADALAAELAAEPLVPVTAPDADDARLEQALQAWATGRPEAFPPIVYDEIDFLMDKAAPPVTSGEQAALVRGAAQGLRSHRSHTSEARHVRTLDAVHADLRALAAASAPEDDDHASADAVQIAQRWADEARRGALRPDMLDADTVADVLFRLDWDVEDLLPQLTGTYAGRVADVLAGPLETAEWLPLRVQVRRALSERRRPSPGV